jgi:(5-formylfuran-3-yl)methyl phosphate synthase
LQLLVSVRSAEEVGPALAGGADIIDAKEPDRGPLGAVDRSVLSEILRQVPDGPGVSVALGDVGSPGDVSAALDGLALPVRTSPTYLKLGFAKVDSPKQIQRLIRTAVAAGSSSAAAPRIIAVAYADWERAGTVRPEVMTTVAMAAGAGGVLLDTHGKEGQSLLQWLSPDELTYWVASARKGGMLTALAGGLRSSDLAVVCPALPDVIGVRGAACSGGRWGRVSASRVRQVRQALERAVFGIHKSGTHDPAGETRDTGAISAPPTRPKSRKLKA